MSENSNDVSFMRHNSKAVHHAYAKHAEVTVPSLDDWEKSFRTGTHPGGLQELKVVPVDFRGASGAPRDNGPDSALLAVAQTN